MSASLSLLEQISFTPDGFPKRFVRIEYCRLHPVCNTCKVFGHDYSKPGQGLTKRFWVKKCQEEQLLVLEKGKQVAEDIDEEIAIPITEAGSSNLMDINCLIAVTQEVHVDTTMESTATNDTLSITPSALPSIGEFNKVVNGAKTKVNSKALMFYF
ncbi:unnamed protein product [Linum trigynum]|uniref:Transposase n=1 Tax=Linum trigynum TaxID=586398 RepID=A0AAV2DAW4_9ROSI